MTNTHNPTAADWLKYVRAQGTSTLDYVTDWLAGCAAIGVEAEPMCEAIDSVRLLITESPIDGDARRYSDGRPVWSEVEIDPAWEPLRYVWHPDPAHHRNQARTCMCELTGPSGFRKRVIISAPGVLDAVTIEPLRAVE